MFSFSGSKTSLIPNKNYDLYTYILSEMLTEPQFEPPICVGMYAKCRSGIAFVLENLKCKLLTEYIYLSVSIGDPGKTSTIYRMIRNIVWKSE